MNDVYNENIRRPRAAAERLKSFVDSVKIRVPLQIGVHVVELNRSVDLIVYSDWFEDRSGKWQQARTFKSFPIARAESAQRDEVLMLVRAMAEEVLVTVLRTNFAAAVTATSPTTPDKPRT